MGYEKRFLFSVIFFEMLQSNDQEKMDFHFNDVSVPKRVLGSSLKFIFRVCRMLFLYVWFFNSMLTHNSYHWP